MPHRQKKVTINQALIKRTFTCNNGRPHTSTQSSFLTYSNCLDIKERQLAGSGNYPLHTALERGYHFAMLNYLITGLEYHVEYQNAR